MTEQDLRHKEAFGARLKRFLIGVAAASSIIFSITIAAFLSPSDLLVEGKPASAVSEEMSTSSELIKVLQIDMLSIFQLDNPYSWGFYFSLLIPVNCFLVSAYNGVRIRNNIRFSLNKNDSKFFIINQKDNFQANIYQRYESYLVDRKKICPEDMMSYHAQYSWGSYAATAMAAMFISLPILILEAPRLHPSQQSVLGWGTLLMAFAGICLASVDLMHKNSQTPLIPNESRFRLIKISIALGSFGILVMLSAILVFLNLLSQMLTFSVGFAVLAILALTVFVRSIPLAELEKHFDLEDGELAKNVLNIMPDSSSEEGTG